jgi:hypothetical protein
MKNINLAMVVDSIEGRNYGGWALANMKKIGLNVDTLKTQLEAKYQNFADVGPGKGGVEADETLMHEMGHVIAKGAEADPELGPEWKSIVASNSFGPGKGYTYSTPGELFAEGFRYFAKSPDVLKVSDPVLFDFMSKVTGRMNELITPIGAIKAGAEQMPRIGGELDQSKILRPGQSPFGDNFQNTEKLARERFDIPNLQKIGAGTDRVVYDAGDNVIKVAKSARGLTQNQGDYLAEDWGLIPKTIESGRNYKVEKMDDGYVISYESKFTEAMAKGGKVKFEDKVKAIKASLLKKKKVSPKVQKDYGKTYSPKEAEDSAKRIVGSRLKKGMK